MLDVTPAMFVDYVWYDKQSPEPYNHFEIWVPNKETPGEAPIVEQHRDDSSHQNWFWNAPFQNTL